MKFAGEFSEINYFEPLSALMHTVGLWHHTNPGDIYADHTTLGIEALAQRSSASPERIPNDGLLIRIDLQTNMLRMRARVSSTSDS
jgi:hypothetical protein